MCFSVFAKFAGKVLSQHYVVMNITATISWSLIWSVYSNLICIDNGLMRARWPWAGYYEVSPTIWLHAHWGQFVTPGWRFLHVPGGGSGFLDVAGAPLHAGTYVTLVPPEGEAGLTVIVETMADTSCLARNLSRFTLTFTTRGGLPGPGTKLYVWSSTQDALFVQQQSLVIDHSSSFTVTIVPDALMTISTVATATHGSFPDSPVPSLAPWPLPYADNFDEYKYDSMARYFADQGGSWAVRNGTLQQVSPGQPIAWAPNGDPLSIIGAEDWVDYAVAATVVFSHGAVSADSDTVLQRWSREPMSSRRLGPGGSRRRQQRLGPGASVSSGSNTLPAYAAPCDARALPQLYSYDASTGRLSSSWGAGGLGCLTSCGCTATCIQMYDCGQGGCGAEGQSYNWTVSSTTPGPLTNQAFPGQALTAAPTTNTVALLPAAGTPAQQWIYNSSTGLLAAPGLGLCLTQLKPTQTYASVCGRMGNYDGFNPATTPAYCLAVYAAGTWAILVNSRPALTGNVSGTFDAESPHRIVISMAGPMVEGYLDGQLLGSITDSTYAIGNAAVGSGWHPAAFDDFQVTVPIGR